MDKSFEQLDNIFNVSSDIVDSSIESENNSKITINKELEKNKLKTDDIEKDYEYTRGNLYSIIEKGQEAINGVLELAQETESPRAYEVLGQLIKNVSDTTDKLLDLQKKIKDIDENNGSKGPTNVTNALFIGSTAELSKLLKQQKNVEESQ
jgi:hypothetical protein